MTEKKIWISLEGNIGAGKTTFLSNVLPQLPVPIITIDEPVAVWQASGMLEKSYKNPSCYGFAAQIHFFTTRIAEHKRVIANYPTANIFMSERSPAADKIFWNTNLSLGLVPSDLGSIYLDMWSLWQDCVAPARQPDCFIYLNTPAETCFARMNGRKREEEDGVPLDYLQALEVAHLEQFPESGAEMPDGTIVPVVVVDGLQDFRQESIAKKIADEIRQYIL